MPRDDIDTDQIIPARFLKTVDRDRAGGAALRRLALSADGSPNPEFVLNRAEMAGRQILLAGDNFGCGSSREHAPWALVAGASARSSAPSFADIFRNNALKNGLLPIEVPPEELGRLSPWWMPIPTRRSRSTSRRRSSGCPNGSSIGFHIDGFRASDDP